jgi:FkbM family methyltransferase
MVAAMAHPLARVHGTVVSSIERAPAFSLPLFRAYTRLLKLYGGPFRAQTYFGSTMLCDPGELLQQLVLCFGVWEPNTSAVIEKLLVAGDICVDIGAHVGYDTLLASHCVGPQGAVIAIEASARTFELLSRNIRENAATNIRLVHKAVSDRPGVLDLYSGPPANIGRTTTVTSTNLTFEGKVDALPLDQILTVEERSRLRLIKMDIEGGEVPVMHRLLDSLDLYQRSLDVLVEVTPSGEWIEIFKQMQSAGFSAYLIENSYDRDWYLKRRHQLTPLRMISTLPDTQSDILFTRGSAPVIA